MGSPYVLAIDQGTTSSRAIIFDHAAQVVALAQAEHQQIFPQPGWVEHDAQEIWVKVQQVIIEVLASAKLDRSDLSAVGITNQRETTVVWDARTGKAIYNAIVWQDTRTQPLIDQLAADGGPGRFVGKTGLPLATYFAGSKITWILDNVPEARARAERGELRCGTIDSWLIWNLTGGRLHTTDVTNASRTLLMDLRTQQWDAEQLSAFRVPRELLADIRPSSQILAEIVTPAELAGVPIGGVLGDQHAATLGQLATTPGAAKNTYGTGCFLVVNTGTEPVFSEHGLITTIAYQLAGQPPTYALEGSVAVAGSLVHWLRDNLGLIAEASEIEQLAASVPDNGGAYLVPAFSGLFAPHWRPDARGALVGLTRFVTRAHLARAALEATALQSVDVVRAVQADTQTDLKELRVDGAMVANSLLMQFQADVLGVAVVRPKCSETTSLGAAFAAGLAVGNWASVAELAELWAEDQRWVPTMDAAARERHLAQWAKAVTRTYDWVD